MSLLNNIFGVHYYRYALKIQRADGRSYSSWVADLSKQTTGSSIEGDHESLSNPRVFMDKLAKKLNIITKEDWYRITFRAFVRNGCGSLLAKHNDSPSALLKSVYPEYRKI